MTKEEELRAEVHALRVEMWKLDKENDNLTAALGSVRAELDNVQDRRGAPTIEAVLTEAGFDRISSMFPVGLGEDAQPLNPHETAISLLWSLVRAVTKRDAMINDEREIADANYAAYHVEAERNIELALKAARQTNALAEYAIRAVERPLDGQLGGEL